MQPPPALQLSENDKLEVLRRLDQFRQWHSLDDKRYCLGCGKIINGHDLQVTGGTRGTGPLRVVCPTAQCPAIPIDWVLPTAEVLQKKNEAVSPASVRAEVKKVPRRRPFKRAFRSIATRFGVLL